MKKNLLMAILLLGLQLLHAQNSAKLKKSISFIQGLDHIVNKDLYRSPYTYSGLNTHARFTFERLSPSTLQRINGSVTFGTLRTGFSPLASNRIFTFGYSWLRKISSGKWGLYLGPQMQVYGSMTNYFPEMEGPGYSKVKSHFQSLSLGLEADLKFFFNCRNHLHLSFAAPVVSLTHRPHFLNGDPQQVLLGAFNYRNPQLNLVYEWEVSDKIAFTVAYRFNYLFCSRPKAIRLLTNGLSVGLKLKF